MSYPLCCPSRATYLTGQYAHNHGVLANSAAPRRLRELRALRTHAPRVRSQDAGLRHRAHRQVPERLRPPSRRVEVPPGWSEWHGVDRPDVVPVLTTSRSSRTATPRPYDDGEYQTDVYTDLATRRPSGATAGDRGAVLPRRGRTSRPTPRSPRAPALERRGGSAPAVPAARHRRHLRRRAAARRRRPSTRPTSADKPLRDPGPPPPHPTRSRPTSRRATGATSSRSSPSTRAWDGSSAPSTSRGCWTTPSSSSPPTTASSSASTASLRARSSSTSRPSGSR